MNNADYNAGLEAAITVVENMAAEYTNMGRQAERDIGRLSGVEFVRQKRVADGFFGRAQLLLAQAGVMRGLKK